MNIRGLAETRCFANSHAAYAFKKGFQMKTVIRFVTIVCFALFSMAVLAQEPTGAIEGTVTDPQGAIVQGAALTVRNAATNFSRSATADDSGHYRISQLPPGTYEVKVSGTNFKTSVVSDVVVAVGQTLPLDIHLEVGGASEIVTVVGGGDVQIDRTDNTVSGVINTRQIQNLPLNGRNFLDLAQLQPGVEKVEGGNFDPTKANYTGVSVAGQAGRSAQIAVDGGSVVDNVVGTTVQNFSQEIVQEFQLGISNFDLSTGASSTGSVNIISKSGTNEFHGNGYFYVRDDRWSAFPSLFRLDAANAIPVNAQATTIPFDREQYGGTIGGPIVHDKLFFFFNYEGNNQDGSALHAPTESPSFSGFTANPFDEKLLTAKIDWVVSNATSVQGRYSFDDNKQDVPFPPGSGIVPQDSASGIFQSNNQLVTNRSHNVVIGTTHTFSPTVTNNFVFNLSDFSNVILPATEGAPQINILGSQLWRSGTNYITPQTTFQERYQFRDDLTVVRGNHTLRFGGNVERTSINGQFAFAKPARIRLFDPATPGAGLTDPVTEADFLNYPVRDISMGIGNDILPFNNGTATNNNRISFYGKDSWKLTKQFTLNYGVSYRVDSNLWNHDQGHPAIIAGVFGKGTAPSPKDKNNIAPTLGFAWDVGGNGRTVVRGGAGIYYDNTIDNLRLFERADLGPAGAELFLVGPDLVSPLFPGGDGRFNLGQLTLGQALALIPAARADIESHAFNCALPTSVECFGSISGPLFSTEFQIPYSLQYSVGLQRELPGGFVFQGDFNYRKGVHEVIIYDVNHFGSEFGPKTTFDNAIPYADSSGFSTYMAGLFRLDRRFSNGFQMTASYALSSFKAFGGDALGLGATVTDLTNIRKEFGPAGLDRKHRFVLSGIYDVPFFRKSSNKFKRDVLGGWQVSLISTAFSGLPQSVFLPNFVDLSRTGTFQSYLPGTGEGSLGRNVKNVGELNAIITAFNASIPSLGDDCGADSPTGRCDSIFPGFFDPIVPLALLPEGTQIGTDSVISQDIRVTKTFSFSENLKLDLIGEVFNVFNVANLTFPTAITLADDSASPDFVKNVNHGPTARTTSVFGTGGPRAFQFAAKFRF
jgi:hypothetical protein